MRFPFFKLGNKAEVKEHIKTPAAATQDKKLAATQRVPLPVLTHSRLVKPAPPVAAPAPPPVASAPAPLPPRNDGPKVPVKVSSLYGQIPTQVFSPEGQATLAHLTIHLPVSVILPQLATGKASLPLGQLLGYFPPAMLRSPLPPHPEAQGVILPLEEIIPAIPADLLNTNPESELGINDPEFDKLPTLIDEESIAAQRAKNKIALAETQPLRRLSDDPFRGIKNTPKAEPAPEPAPGVASEPPKESSPIIVPPRPHTDIPESIVISLRAVTQILPDNVFNGPRSQVELATKDREPVLLPSDSVIPQLRTGSVRLPASVLVSLLPLEILANPLPNLEGVNVSLPLAEIITQLPAHVFTDQLREAAPAEPASELDIPDPFQEKSTPPPLPTATVAAPELDSAALADESFAIFAEKSPAPTPKAPELSPTPVAETPAAPVMVTTPAPVVEPPPAPVAPVVETPVAAVVPEATPATSAVEPEPEVAVPTAPLEPAYADADADIDLDDEPLLPTPVPAGAAQPFDDKKLLVDLNRCTVEDLMSLPGVGRALAQRIIDFRNARGSFASLEELRQVPGIGRKTYRALAGVQPRALNRLLGAEHDGELTLQEIVRLTGKLPGITGCMLALSDGLFLTGQLPEHLDQNTISVFAPQLFKKVGRYSRELKVGQIRRFTIFTDTQPLSIFKAGEVYLIIVHDAQRFSKALLRRCERISEEIARLSSQRVTV